MSGEHGHADIDSRLSALEARVAALETGPAPPDGLYAPIWPVTEVPTPAEVWHYNGDPQRLRDLARAGNIHITVPPGEIPSDGRPIEVGRNTILRGLGEGFIYNGAGIYVLGDHVVVDNVETQGAEDGMRVYQGAADQVLITRYSCGDAIDECLDIWDAWQGAAKRVTIERAHLGYGARHGSAQPWSMIVGGAGSPTVGLYASVLEGGFRNPFINGTAYVYAALNVLPVWGIQGMGGVSGARLAVDRNWYGYTGFHGARAHEPNNTGNNDNSVGIRNLGGNHYETAPNRYEWQPHLVELPGELYLPRTEMNATTRSRVVEEAGRGS